MEVRKVAVRWMVKAISFVMIFRFHRPRRRVTRGCCKKGVRRGGRNLCFAGRQGGEVRRGVGIYLLLVSA